MDDENKHQFRFTDSQLEWAEGKQGSGKSNSSDEAATTPLSKRKDKAPSRYVVHAPNTVEDASEGAGAAAEGRHGSSSGGDEPAAARKRGRIQELSATGSSERMPADVPTPGGKHLASTTVRGSRHSNKASRHTRTRTLGKKRLSIQLDPLGNPYEFPDSCIPEGRTRPWSWSLRFWDPHLEREWLRQLYKRRRGRTWVLQAVGTFIFLLLVLTDLSASIFAGDTIDSFAWWKAAFRLGTGFVAASLLLVEQLVRSLRAPFWLKIRTVNVLLCCVWAVVFAPVGGLADLMASAPILASCDGGGDFVMQEIRMHPAVLLLLFAGPVLELPYVHVGIAATMTGATELALALAAHLHGNLFVVFDHVGVTLMLILASTMTAYSTEQSARSLFLQNFSLTKENLHLNQVLSMRGLKDDKARRTKIVSNSEKMVEVINRLRDRFGEDDDDLSEALELIQLSGGLFAPDLTELELSQDVEAPIKEWLLTGPARLGDQKVHVRRKAASVVEMLQTSRSGKSQQGVPRSAVVQFLASVDVTEYALDVLELAERTPRVLCLVAESVIVSMNLVDACDLDREVLHAFLSRLDSGYVATNPYHNATHGASVTWDMQHYLRHGRAERFMTRTEVLACLIAAASHDFKHPGRNNQFLTTLSDEIAIRYNDQSVLENFHVAETFALGLSDEAPLFVSMERDMYRRLRAVVVSMVLATDVSKHFGHVALLKTKSLATPSANAEAMGSVEDVDLMMVSLIMVCDLGHAAKPFEMHERWTDLVTEEFFRQGDDEKQRGVKVSPLCDRDTTDLAKSQIGFFDFLVLPLFEAFSTAHFVYNFMPILTQVRANHTAWQRRQHASEPTPARRRSDAPLHLEVEAVTSPPGGRSVRQFVPARLSDASSPRAGSRRTLEPLGDVVSSAVVPLTPGMGGLDRSSPASAVS